MILSESTELVTASQLVNLKQERLYPVGEMKTDLLGDSGDTVRID